jgi:hypothetical protein
LIDAGIAGGAGDLEVLLDVVDPTNGQPWTGADWNLVGSLTDTYVVPLGGGTKIPLVVNSMSTAGSIEFVILTGLAAGVYTIVVGGRELGIRTNAGDWLGTFAANATVS